MKVYNVRITLRIPKRDIILAIRKMQLIPAEYLMDSTLLIPKTVAISCSLSLRPLLPQRTPLVFIPIHSLSSTQELILRIIWVGWTEVYINRLMWILTCSNLITIPSKCKFSNNSIYTINLPLWTYQIQHQSLRIHISSSIPLSIRFKFLTSRVWVTNKPNIIEIYRMHNIIVVIIVEQLAKAFKDY